MAAGEMEVTGTHLVWEISRRCANADVHYIVVINCLIPMKFHFLGYRLCPEEINARLGRPIVPVPL